MSKRINKCASKNKNKNENSTRSGARRVMPASQRTAPKRAPQTIDEGKDSAARSTATHNTRGTAANERQKTQLRERQASPTKRAAKAKRKAEVQRSDQERR